jgi:hypothetical protein
MRVWMGLTKPGHQVHHSSNCRAMLKVQGTEPEIVPNFKCLRLYYSLLVLCLVMGIERGNYLLLLLFGISLCPVGGIFGSKTSRNLPKVIEETKVFLKRQEYSSRSLATVKFSEHHTKIWKFE